MRSNQLDTQKFIDRANQIHKNKYNYDKLVYIKSQIKVTIICPEHGEFEQLPHSHLSGIGCSKCHYDNIRLTTKTFIEKAIAIHGNKYDYTKAKYVNNYTKVTIICSVHGEFEQTPHNHLKGYNCHFCHGKDKLTINSFIQKAIAKHGDKYDYSKVIYNNIYHKVTINCPLHDEFEQTPAAHLIGQGCPKCGKDSNNISKKYSQIEFIEKAQQVHNNKYNYSKVIYLGCNIKVTIICQVHGKFYQTPTGHLSGRGCPICKASKGELAIKTILDKHSIEVKQEWKIPDEKYLFEYDFYLPQLNILIEFHGKQHYEYIHHFYKTYHRFEEQRMRDKNKIILAKLKGIPLIEFNYKQFKYLSKEQFEDLVISEIKRKVVINA